MLVVTLHYCEYNDLSRLLVFSIALIFKDRITIPPSKEFFDSIVALMKQ